MSMYRPKEEGTNEYVGSHSHIGKNFFRERPSIFNSFEL